MSDTKAVFQKDGGLQIILGSQEKPSRRAHAQKFENRDCSAVGSLIDLWAGGNCARRGYCVEDARAEKTLQNRRGELVWQAHSPPILTRNANDQSLTMFDEQLDP